MAKFNPRRFGPMVAMTYQEASKKDRRELEQAIQQVEELLGGSGARRRKAKDLLADAGLTWTEVDEVLDVVEHTALVQAAKTDLRLRRKGGK